MLQSSTGRRTSPTPLDGRPTPAATLFDPFHNTSIPSYGAMIKRPMDLQSMYFKVRYGAFGGLHLSAVADSAPAPAPATDAQGGLGVLVDPNAVASANPELGGVPLSNGNLSSGGGAGAVSAPAGGAIDGGDDDDSAVIDGFFNSEAVAGGGGGGDGGSDGMAPHGGSNGGALPAGGANGGPKPSAKGPGGETGLPGLISPVAAHQDAVRGGLFSFGGDGGERSGFADGGTGQDVVGYGGRGGGGGGGVASSAPPAAAGGNGNPAGANRAEEPGVGVPVVATSVPFGTATAPFDHVSFFRDMKLVRVISRYMHSYCCTGV